MTWLGGQSNWRKFAFLLVLMVTLCSFYLSVENGDSQVISENQNRASTFSSLKAKLPFSSQVTASGFKGTLTYPHYPARSSENLVSIANLTPSRLVPDRGYSAAFSYKSFTNSTSDTSKSKTTPWNNSAKEKMGSFPIKSFTPSRNNVTRTGTKTGLATIATEPEMAKSLLKSDVQSIATRPQILNDVINSEMKTAATETTLATAIKHEESKGEPTGRKPNAVLIVTAKRSGSSFVGEFFNYHPDVFYNFEPLYAVAGMAMKMRGKKINFIETSLQVLKDSLHCDFHSSYPFQYSNAKFCSANAKLAGKHLCGKSFSRTEQKIKLSAWERTCKEHKVIAAKLIRIHDIGDLKPLLSNTDLEWRIIHLVRDPRPTERSRKKTRPNADLIRRKGTDKNDEVDLCQTLQRNLKYWVDTPSWLKGKYRMVRFEDIAASPLEKAKELLDFVGLDLASEVVKWIKENTVTAKKNPTRSAQFSTSRNAAWVLEAWRHDMSWPFVEKIQKVCSAPMKSLGYALMPDVNSLRDERMPSTMPLKKPQKL